ncbi:MAG: SUMF1/EgtB/PvdO family nonheme iron enzyme, partial [Candidatus Marinimicrobia bacterium]|nr:SUMF1/EgtB/PvdO family nonheme iron enzyme [Candidatus Neomarinimicrobiota bacterium]
MNKIVYFLFFVLIVLTGCSQSQSITTFPSMTLVQAPIGSQQMAPAVFLNSAQFEQLKVPEGDVCLISIGDESREMRVYKFRGDSNQFALRYAFGTKKYKLKKIYNLSVKSVNNPTLAAQSLDHKVIKISGDTHKWNKIAIGAPHGDCDYNTAEISKIINKKFGIPVTTAYMCRYTANGLWFDCNRPLMKMPNPKGGTIPERVWNDDAVSIYENYQKNVLENSLLKKGERFELFTSFHGHDLTVTLDDGRKVSRDVMEALGVGFTDDELRRMKDFYYQNANRYYENPPSLYFGNLEEDRKYEFSGKMVDFFYSGLGTRMYGTMQSKFIKRGIHIETPNSIRLDPEVWLHTADFLGELYIFIRDSIITDAPASALAKITEQAVLNEKIAIAGGEFLRGAANGSGWSSERPQHLAHIDAFSMDKTEVTNSQFVVFLNEAYEKNQINIRAGIVYSSNDKVLFKTQES